MADSPETTEPSRRWVSAVLLGSHLHKTSNGFSVGIAKRDSKYLARGRYHGILYCETLGAAESEANSRLRQLLSDLENGTFLFPQERRQQMVNTRPAKPVSFTQLLALYISEVRKTKGQKTSQDYRSRLSHIERFASRPEISRKYPNVTCIDRTFILDAKAYLQNCVITANGHPHSKPKPMSQRQIYNVMSAFGALLLWAQRPDIRRLPAHWINPVTREIIGNKPRKDPFRRLPLEDDQLVQLIEHSDIWQLCHLMLNYLFPLRPGEAEGLLVGDVDFTKRELQFGTRLGGSDYTKGHQDFVLPFPDELSPLLHHLVDGRASGPLLRRRHHQRQSRLLHQPGSDMTADFHSYLMEHPEGNFTQQDQKRRFRQFLTQLGGVGSDTLTREFNKVKKQAGIKSIAKLYDLRSLNSTKMARAGVPHLALRYFTAHTTADILNTYVPLDPHQDILPYFQALQPLLDLASKRLAEFGIKEKP